jgi:glutamate synthase (NADPH/NADH) large chain
VRQGLRMQTGLVVETGEAREVHHFCVLAGYGAEAVNPYLAFETLEASASQGLPLTPMTFRRTTSRRSARAS